MGGTMSPTLLLLSGPNLSQLGVRDPSVYGTQSLNDHVEAFSAVARSAGYDVEHISAEGESGLVQAIHAARGRVAGLAINPGALTHSSWSLRDALHIFDGPAVELHLSNPAAREPFRAMSTIAGVVRGSIAGFGPLSYVLAARALLALLDEE
jgi:3-dehydroquinate dehydratase II